MDVNRLKKGYAKWVENSTMLVSYAETSMVIAICVYFELKNSHPLLTSILILLAGWFVWILTEYLVHRFVFHFQSKNKYMLLLRYIFHGVHHHYPSKSLFAPIILRMITQVLVFLFFVLLFKEYAILAFLGIVIGVVHYITVHYCLHHHKWRAYFPRLTKFHYIHHYLEPNSCFGTTTLLFDKLFGTLPKKKFSEIKFEQESHFI